MSGLSGWRQGRYLFLVIATLCLGFYGYTLVDRVLFQSYESRLFDQLPDRNASVAPLGQDSAGIGRIDYTSPRSAQSWKSAASVSVIGRLSVPRLHLSAMVSEGVDATTLRRYIGHIPNTALPGQAGNVGVAGHRDTFFRGLKDLRAGDRILFATARGNFKYQVESLRVVDPDNVAVLAPSLANTLTMVTCYPFSYIGSAPKRFIVSARQVSPQPPSQAIEPFAWEQDQ